MAPNKIALDALEYLVNRKRPEDLTLRLFANDIVPAEDDIAGRYKAPTFAGYKPILLRGPNWSQPTKANPSTSYPTQEFLCEASDQDEHVFGYLLTRGSEFVLAERFTNGPFRIQYLGQSVQVTPTIVKRRQ